MEHFTEGINTIIDIISMYVSYDAPLYALKALERLTLSPSVVYWWNALIRRDVCLGFLDNALDIYRRMQILGWKADYFTYPFVLKACGEIPSLKRGTHIHYVVCCNGFDSNVFVCNALVAMYSRCGAFEETRQVFDEMYEREMDDVVSWNSIVATYMQSGNLSEALRMFGRMTKDICQKACERPVPWPLISLYVSVSATNKRKKNLRLN